MDGQRILAQMHAHCTQYRLQVKDTLHKLKEQEYAAAKVRLPIMVQACTVLPRRANCKRPSTRDFGIFMRRKSRDGSRYLALGRRL